MANSNTLTTFIPQILAQAILELRANCVMPRLVNTDYGEEAKEKGDSVDIPIPATLSASAVSPSYVAPDDDGITPTKVNVPLSSWYEVPFFLSDKDMKNAMDGLIPSQLASAVKALANQVDSDLFSVYTGIYGFAGTPGVTPFGTNTKEATDAGKVLNDNLAPPSQRRFVMSTATNANALGLRPFQDMSFSGDASAINEGRIINKLGFDWHMDQSIPTHLTGAQDGAYVVNGVNALASTSLVVKTGTGDIHAGDQFTIAGDSQVYVVTTLHTGGAGTLTISPGLKVATSGDEALTFKGTASTTYQQDIFFQREAIVFASRPLLDVDPTGRRDMMSMTDPVSGLTMRFEISTQHRRTRFSVDMLYGYKLVRPELAGRVWGASV